MWNTGSLLAKDFNTKNTKTTAKWLIRSFEIYNSRNFWRRLQEAYNIQVPFKYRGLLPTVSGRWGDENAEVWHEILQNIAIPASHAYWELGHAYHGKKLPGKQYKLHKRRCRHSPGMQGRPGATISWHWWQIRPISRQPIHASQRRNECFPAWWILLVSLYFRSSSCLMTFMIIKTNNDQVTCFIRLIKSMLHVQRSWILKRPTDLMPTLYSLLAVCSSWSWFVNLMPWI